MSFFIRQRLGVDNTTENTRIQMEIKSIKEIGQFDFIRSRFEFYATDYPYLKIEPLPEDSLYLIFFHHNGDYYPLATLKDKGGNIEDRIWFMFLMEWKKFKLTRGYFYD